MESLLATIGGKRGAFLSLLPELSLVRFQGEAIDGRQDSVFTFIRNRAHYNVKFLFDEESRYVPKENTLSIIKEFHGSYPNFFFNVPEGKAAQFVESLTQLKEGDESFRRFIDTYGARRSDPDFWKLSDFFAERFSEVSPSESGVLDLNRYENY